MKQLKIQKVLALPETLDTDTLYLLKNSEGDLELYTSFTSSEQTIKIPNKVEIINEVAIVSDTEPALPNTSPIWVNKTTGTLCVQQNVEGVDAWVPITAEGVVSFGNIQNLPTTRDGFGITDVPKSDGTDATGTWNISIHGNADTASMASEADTLVTPRAINGTSFDGSADITTGFWGMARNLTIGSMAKSVNGSQNVSWTLTEIGAPALNGTGATGTWGISINGNAATATTALTADKLTTSRTITLSGDISGTATFDGSSDANITVTVTDDSHNHSISTITGLQTALDGKLASGATAVAATKIVATAETGTTAELIRATMGGSDKFRILVGGATADAGYAEIAVCDNGTEPIYIRQYSGPQEFTTLVRSLTLLDESGNSSFPGTVTAPLFIGALNGNASSATSANTANSATTATFQSSPDGDRLSTTKLPTSNPGLVRFDFISGGQGGVSSRYAGLMTYAPWDGLTSSTGDASYQLVFGGTASDNAGMPMLNIRAGIDTTWGTWYTLLHSGNYNNYSPSLTGTGASGTWGINITGSAATATNISNAGTVTLATATESNSITVTQPAYIDDQPVKLLNFDWYGNKWSLGNIRSSDTGSNGFGVYFTDVEKFRFTTTDFKILGNITLHAGNYNAYAPTLTGANASGTWGINITGNAATASSATVLVSQGNYDATAPGTTRGPAGLNFFNVYNNGYPVTYGTLLHICGAGAGQILVGWSGVDGSHADNFIRSKRDNNSGVWSGWAKLLTDQNYSSYSPTLTGGGASGTWGISINGNAATATTATNVSGGTVNATTGTFTGVTSVVAVNATHVALASGAINLAAGSSFSYTLTAATTFSLSNVPASGKLVCFILELTNAGAYTTTLWSNIKWAGGTVPTLTASGRDVLGFYTRDGGATWTGTVIAKDAK